MLARRADARQPGGSRESVAPKCCRPIPSNVNLLRAHAYLQAYCYAPGANALEIIASNGIDWLIGNQ